ncbi:MAG: hypothetical protein ABI548_19560 [Polyangiaceae bacterium]
MQRNSVLTQVLRVRQAPAMLKGSGTRKLGGRDPLRAFQRFLAWSLVALFVSLFPSRAHAYAWMIKHSYAGCPVCHADPSGGELLTAYGRAQSDLLLRMRYGKPGGSSTGSSEGSSDSSFDSFDSDDDSKKPAAAPAKTDANSGADDADANADADADKPATADADKPADAGEKPADAAAAPSTEHKDLKIDDSSSTDTSGFLWGLVNTPDWLLLGGSYRQLAIYTLHPSSTKFTTFPMMADVYGQVSVGHFRVEGSLGVVRVGVGSPYARAAQITGNQGDQWNLLSRTHWLGYDFMDGQLTLRGGHLNLPFGVRIPEHTMWVRQATRTDRESAQQDGVALAFNGENFRGEVMAIAGNYQVRPDKYRERGYSLYAEYLTSSRTAIGISSLVTSAQEDRVTLDPKVIRQAHGVFMRSAFNDQVTLLAEADGLFRTDHEAGYVGFAQLDYEITQGLHLMGTGEVLDQGYDKVVGGVRGLGSGQPQLGAWGTVDWFCLPHVEFRVDLFSRQNDQTTILGQLHVFL